MLYLCIGRCSAAIRGTLFSCGNLAAGRTLFAQAFLWLFIFLLHLFAFEEGRSSGQMPRRDYLPLRSGVTSDCGSSRNMGLQIPHGLVRPVRATLTSRALGDWTPFKLADKAPYGTHRVRCRYLAEQRQLERGIRAEYLSSESLATILLIGACRKVSPSVRALGQSGSSSLFADLNLFDLNATVAEHGYLQRWIPHFATGCCLDFPRTLFRSLVPSPVWQLSLTVPAVYSQHGWVDEETFTAAL